ncbi:MAG: hypothetical protein AB7R55_07540 [Gemmatimonadales bacterium]
MITKQRTTRWSALLLAGLAVTAAGCDSLTDVEERDTLPPEAIANAAGANALYLAAVQTFVWALNGDGGGGTEGQVLISGMLADEFRHSGTFSTRVDYDMRASDLNNSTLALAFRNLHDGRVEAHRAISAISALPDFDAATDDRIPELNNAIGIIFLTSAQNYCNGIPFSNYDGATLIPGEQLTNVQMVDSSAVYFDRALAGAGGSGSLNHHVARLMKARGMILKSRSNLGAAASLVATVPTTMMAPFFHADTPINLRNGIYVFNVQNERWTVAHRDGGNGLPFLGDDAINASLADPRVPWKRDGSDVGFDNTTPQYDLQIYKTNTATSTYGLGIEARLIEAEADLEAGATQAWLDKLNNLRATVTGLAPLSDPGSDAARVDLMFSERAFWLFARGTRLMDLRRLVRQYGRNSEDVFPSGSYFKGGTYGPDVNLPVPTVENQNPLYASGIACLDRNA